MKLSCSHYYNEINLNVGCPSKAVQKGSFGACLMKNKKLVRNCLAAMNNACDIDVSIKCRIGLSKDFNYDFLSLWHNKKTLDVKNWIKKTNCHCTYDCAWSLNILGNAKYQPELIGSVFGKSW